MNWSNIENEAPRWCSVVGYCRQCEFSEELEAKKEEEVSTITDLVYSLVIRFNLGLLLRVNSRIRENS